MLINLDPGYMIRGRETFKNGLRAEPVYLRDTVEQARYVAEELGCAVGVDADSTALNYDTARVFNGRSRIGTVRAWVNVWAMPGVAA